MADTMAEARFWDRVARRYAKSRIKDMAGYERTLERTRTLLHDTDTVLEIGCGTGTTALKLAPGVGRLVATDVSAEMIAIANEKRAVSGARHVEFRVESPLSARSNQGAYDAALAFNVLHLVADRAAALAALFGALKPGGLLISKTPCLSEMNVAIRYVVPVMRAIGKAPYVDIFSARDLERDIAEAGFSIIERARHGSGRKDARIFLVARKPG